MKQQHLFFASFLAFLHIFAFTPPAYALGIAIVPDHLLFDGSKQPFHIINPNNETIIFNVEGKIADCTPEKGELKMLESIAVTCTATDSTVGEGTIIIKTEPKERKNTIGVIPAVAIKINKIGNKKFTADNNKNNQHTPANIKEKKQASTTSNSSINDVPENDEKKKKEIPQAKTNKVRQEEKELPKKHTPARFLRHMRPETILITILTAAIMYVLAYSHLKEKKEKKEGSKQRTEETNKKELNKKRKEA